jgi:hypothetical protein
MLRILQGIACEEADLQATLQWLQYHEVCNTLLFFFAQFVLSMHLGEMQCSYSH